MTKDEKLSLAMKIVEELEADIKKIIQAGRLPEEWTGIEIRQWVADYLAANWPMKMRQERMRLYRKDVRMGNLLREEA